MLFLLFTLVPAIEIYFLIQIGQAIGGFETFLLIVLTGIVGAQLARSQGFALLRRIQEEALQGIPSSTTVAEGLLILIGGILLITPGVITDAMGLLFIFPLSRKLLAPRILKRLQQRGQFHSSHGMAFGGTFSTGSSSANANMPTEPSKEKAPFKHPIQ